MAKQQDDPVAREAEREAVMAKLRRYRDRFTELVNLRGDKLTLAREEKQRLQQLLKGLKEDLAADCKRSRDATAGYEATCFYPAVQEAHAHIHVPWNSNPLSEKWFSEVYTARDDISYYLSQLSKEAGD